MTPVDNRSTPGRLRALFDGYAPGRGKWKSIAMELLNLEVVKDNLIDQSVYHIKNNVYTKTSWDYTVDMSHGVNLSGIVHRDIEKEMQKEIEFDIVESMISLRICHAYKAITLLIS
jgi:hypothetical protein